MANGTGQYLQQVTALLYRPPAAGRQVFALSRAEAERLPALPHVAAISITAPDKGPANLDAYPYLLRLSFADVDFSAANLSERAKGKLPHAFTAKQAQEVIAFISALPADVHSLVVHCEGGYSRSCAVATFAQQVYGFKAHVERLGGANPSVLALLLACAKAAPPRR